MRRGTPCEHLWRDGWCDACGLGYATWQSQRIAAYQEAIQEVQALAEEFTSGKWDAGYHNTGRSLLDILKRYNELAPRRG